MKRPSTPDQEVTNVIAFRTRDSREEKGRIVPNMDQTSRYLPRSHRPRVVACVTIVLAVAAALTFHERSPTPTRYMTHVGEQREIKPAEGLSISMNTNTAIDVTQVSGQFVEVRLLHGEALFRVQHTTHTVKPLQVVVDDTVIRDVGTTFDVYRHDNRITKVSVLEGSVQVSSAREHDHPSAPAADSTAASLALSSSQAELRSDPHVLGAGDVEDFLPSGLPKDPVSRKQVRDLEHKLSWLKGQLDFSGETLQEVVAEFNRYNQRQIVITDPRIDSARIGGRFTATDPSSFADAIARGKRVRRLPPDAGRPDADVIRLGATAK